MSPKLACGRDEQLGGVDERRDPSPVLSGMTCREHLERRVAGRLGAGIMQPRMLGKYALDGQDVVQDRRVFALLL